MNQVGLVVAGAGARGAYEAGALSVLVPRMAADGARPALLVGTIAGALNVVGLAGLAHLPPADAAGALVDLWGAVHLDQVANVLPSLAGDGLRFAGQVLGLPVRLPSLLDTGRQRRTLAGLLPFEALHDNVASGLVGAVAVAATSATTGGTVVFVERHPSVPLPPDDDTRNIRYVDTRLTIDHALASAAVPVAFRPVRVREPVDDWYLDGGVRLNVPLKPALALGATRLGVVATHPAAWPVRPAPDAAPVQPDVFRAASLSLQALLADRMVEDLRTLSKVNDLAGGDPRYREVPFLFAGPAAAERDEIGALAREVFAATYAGLRGLRNPPLWFLDRLIGGAAADHGELLSFLLFEPSFTTPAAALGARHARESVTRWATSVEPPRLVSLDR